MILRISKINGRNRLFLLRFFYLDILTKGLKHLSRYLGRTVISRTSGSLTIAFVSSSWVTNVKASFQPGAARSNFHLPFILNWTSVTSFVRTIRIVSKVTYDSIFPTIGLLVEFWTYRDAIIRTISSVA